MVEEPEVIRYGRLNENNHHKAARIDLNEFDSYLDLLFRIHEMACNDSIPTIVLNDKGMIIELGLSNPCWEGVACMLIKSRNILKIHDETIRHGSDIYQLSSLKEELSKHYCNNANEQSPIYSETPHDLIIKIFYEDIPFIRIDDLLLRLVKEYDSQNVNVPLKIWLERYLPPPPPPPMTNFK